MSGNVIKKLNCSSSRPSSVVSDFYGDNGDGDVVMRCRWKDKMKAGEEKEYQSCVHHRNYVLDREGLSRSDHLRMLSKAKVIVFGLLLESLLKNF
jgi:hypothetical protein